MRRTPEIPSASMADIAFMLLIFFITATSMDVDSGLERVLPQMPPENQEKDDTPPIKERNVFSVLLDANNRLMVEGELLRVEDLRLKTKEFIQNTGNIETLPEKKPTEIPLLGEYPVTKGVISLRNDQGTQYGTYLAVQNELVAAINELRDELASEKFGKTYANCTIEQKDAIRDAIPSRISEAEPKKDRRETIMSKFRKSSGKETPAISTASLPDIVFMLLFFFMVTTTIRDVSLLVKIKTPTASELTKLEKKSLVSYIYVGPPQKQYTKVFGTEPRIQLNDQFQKVSDIPDFIIAERAARSEAELPFMVTSLKVDEFTKMQIVGDIKQELRKAAALHINYSSRKAVVEK